MDELIKLLDPELDYIEHELLDDTIIIRVASNRKELLCPYCGYSSSKRHFLLKTLIYWGFANKKSIPPFFVV